MRNRAGTQKPLNPALYTVLLPPLPRERPILTHAPGRRRTLTVTLFPRGAPSETRTQTGGCSQTRVGTEIPTLTVQSTQKVEPQEQPGR